MTRRTRLNPNATIADADARYASTGVHSLGNLGSTYTLTSGNATGVAVGTLTANTTITLPTPFAGAGFILVLQQDATGGRTPSFVGTVDYPAGNISWVPTANALNVIQFCAWDTTTWHVFPATTNSSDIAGNAATATLATALVNGVASDFILVQVGNTARAAGYGDFAVGHYVGRAFTATSITYQFDTVDASGNTLVELRKNGTQVASSNLTVSAANQADGTSTDASRTATINTSFAVGDRIAIYTTSVGTTPGKGLRAWVKGTWN